MLWQSQSEDDMRRKAAALVLILVLFVVGLVVWNHKSAKQAAPDGTVLLLSGLKIGRTNVYTHGTAPSRILGHLVPSNGITLFGLKLQRPNIVIMPAPDGCEMLTAELQLVAAASPREHILVSPPFYRKYRLLISGERNGRNRTVAIGTKSQRLSQKIPNLRGLSRGSPNSLLASS